MKRGPVGLALVSAAIVLLSHAVAQSCPPDDGSLRSGVPTTISGTIRNHNDLRGWIGLELSRQVCGQKELQLTFVKGDSSARYRTTAALDGCKAAVTGSIEFSPTAHYSTEMFIQDGKIEPDSSRHPAAVAPDRWSAAIPSDLQVYEATVTLNFANTAKPMRGTVVRRDGKVESLTPWQAYLSPLLNGSEDLLWVSCRDGFLLKDAATQIDGRVAKPENWLNKETPALAASDKPGPSSITVTCVKNSNQVPPTSSNK